MDEEVEKRIRGKIEEGVLVGGKIRIIGVREGEFWSIGASSTVSEDLRPNSGRVS